MSVVRPRAKIRATISKAVASIPIRIDSDWDDRLGRIVLTLIDQHRIRTNTTRDFSRRIGRREVASAAAWLRRAPAASGRRVVERGYETKSYD